MSSAAVNVSFTGALHCPVEQLESFVIHFSRMFTLKENEKKWEAKEVCMGDSSYCNGPGITGDYAMMILSFGEDESGITLLFCIISCVSLF